MSRLADAPINTISVPDNRLRELGDYTVLAASMSEIGLLQPITVAESGVLVIGYHRLEAAKSLGWETIPAFVVEDDELRNRLSEIDENLKRLDLTVYEQSKHAAERERVLDALGQRAKAENGAALRDGPPATVAGGPKTTEQIAREAGMSERSWQNRTKIGRSLGAQTTAVLDHADLFEEKQRNLLNSTTQLNHLADISNKRGDQIAAQVAERVLAEEGASTFNVYKDIKKEQRKQEREAEEERRQVQALARGEERFSVTDDDQVVSCDALITDPPYGILEETWEPRRIEEFTREWASRWSVSGADTISIFFSQRYLFQALEWFNQSLAGYEFRQLLVWHYPNNKSPQNRLGFKQTWEPIFFYRRIGSERKIEPRGGEWGEGLNDFDCHVGAVPQSNFNGPNAKVHPAQKPVSVMSWLVSATTEPGDLVADPFCGSGTTGIAALQLHRRFHGVEQSEEYREVAMRRIAAYGDVV